MTTTKGNKTIQTLMIVEDEALVSILLRDELQKAGYKVLDLTDGFDAALEVAKANKPDLALVNIRLARGDDGIELSKHLKGLGIPVLLISGQVSRASSAKTVAIGSMPKPYDPDEMVLAVAYLLASLNGGRLLREGGANDEGGIAYTAQLSEAPVDLTKHWEWKFEPPRSLAGTSLPLDLTIGTVAAERAGIYSDVLTIELSAI
jgi:DNA-binding response OmpR family regulator